MKEEREEKRDLYLHKIFSLMKRKDVQTRNGNKKFSNTELRLLAELLSAKYEGKRLISTRIAEVIGVTRSAVSQMVNKLEAEGIVKRVADAVDKKIAYIEITEEALSLYNNELEELKNFTAEVVEKFGEEKFQTLCSLFEEFTDCLAERKSCFEKQTKRKKLKKK